MVETNKCSINDKEMLLIQHELKVIEGIFESKEKYRKIIQAGIARWVKDFQAGRIKIETVDDLKKLIEIDLELQKDDI
ncbi:hypothetical protein [Desulfotomaculum sp. 1211_IL3151]|uniref:hypothetical protein n=1 Tax=Desulfotomaculum sp. 1211_IL3151 TaxID=3084055 RepID=UPI002FDB0B2A